MVFPSAPLFTELGAYDVANHVPLWLVWHKKSAGISTRAFRYDVFIHSFGQLGRYRYWRYSRPTRCHRYNSLIHFM
jgi:hypothetical protein